jgi:hypothetical protein
MMLPRSAVIDDANDPLHGAVRPFACYAQGWRLIKDDYWRFVGIAFLAIFIGNLVPFGFLLGPVWCGLEIYLLRRMAGQRADLGNLFEGFNYFAPSLVPSVILITLATGAFLLVWLAYAAGSVGLLFHRLANAGGPDAALVWGYGGLTLLYVVGAVLSWVVLTSPFVFVFSLIVDRRLSGFAALWTSLRAVFANFWGVLGLLMLDTLLSGTGNMLFCFGWFLVFPVNLAASVVAYRQVFPRIVVEDDWDTSAPEPAAHPAPVAGPSSTDIRSDTPPQRPAETGIVPGAPGD